MERSSFRWPRSLHGKRLRQARLSTTPWESLTPVARTRELKGIGESQGRSCLVILPGPGGVVRIRLELELGPVPKWLAGVGGVWLVELAPSSDVVAAVAHTLGISSRAGAALTDALRGSVADRDMLPVQDNCGRSLMPVQN